jgi:hypothetical protein
MVLRAAWKATGTAGRRGYAGRGSSAGFNFCRGWQTLPKNDVSFIDKKKEYGHLSPHLSLLFASLQSVEGCKKANS